MFGQVKRKAKRPGGMLAGRPPSGANSVASRGQKRRVSKKDTIEMTNNLVSMKGGRATYGDTHELVAARGLSPC